MIRKEFGKANSADNVFMTSNVLEGRCQVAEYLAKKIAFNVPAAIEIRKTGDETLRFEVLVKEYPRYQGASPFGDIRKLNDLDASHEGVVAIVSAVDELAVDVTKNAIRKADLTDRQTRAQSIRERALGQLCLLEAAKERLARILEAAELSLSAAVAITEDAIFGDEPEPPAEEPNDIPF